MSNTHLGVQALQDITTGNYNTGIGAAAGRACTTGNDNTLLGSSAERANLTGVGNVTVGASAGIARTTGSYNTVVGTGAMNSVVLGGDNNVAIGRSALRSNSGSDAVAVGAYALEAASGERNTAVGRLSGVSITVGESNSFFGYRAGGVPGQGAGVSRSTAIGFEAYTTSDDQVALGGDSVGEIRALGMTLARGGAASANTFFGGAASGAMTGQANAALGWCALNRSENTNLTTAIGRNAGYWGLGYASCVLIGASAGQNANNATPGVLPPGTLLGSPIDCVAVGVEAGRDWQGVVGCTAVGRISQMCTTTGTNNTSIGDAALRDNVTGQQNSAGGYGCMAFNTTGSRNAIWGQAGLYRSVVGDENSAIGYEVFEFLEGSKNVGAGYRAGRSLTAGENNVIIGSNCANSPSQKADSVNCVAIGAGAFTTRDNEVVIGTDSHTHLTLNGVEFSTAQVSALLAFVS